MGSVRTIIFFCGFLKNWELNVKLVQCLTKHGPLTDKDSWTYGPIGNTHNKIRTIYSRISWQTYSSRTWQSTDRYLNYGRHLWYMKKNWGNIKIGITWSNQIVQIFDTHPNDVGLHWICFSKFNSDDDVVNLYDSADVTNISKTPARVVPCLSLHF